jgi:hypothetical protein
MELLVVNALDLDAGCEAKVSIGKKTAAKDVDLGWTGMTGRLSMPWMSSPL